MVLALIVLSALGTLGTLTVVSVQSSLKASTSDRTQAVALYAAESGAAYAMDFLRANAATIRAYFDVANIPTTPDPKFPNRALPEATENPFSRDQSAWFEIEVKNNRDDPGYRPPLLDGSNDPANADTDQRVILRSTGHGPQGSVTVVEWEVELINIVPPPQPLPPPVPPVKMFDGSDPKNIQITLLGWHVVEL